MRDDSTFLISVYVYNTTFMSSELRDVSYTERFPQRRSHCLKSPDLSHRDQKLSTLFISPAPAQQGHRKVDALRAQ
jgi:hypothetical protein